MAERGQEINEGIMELYMEYLSAREGKPTDRVGVRYLVPKFDEEKEVLILESPNLLSGSGTTGLRTWEAARALGELLSIPFSDPSLRSESESNEKIPQVDVRGKKVLELGAGTGFVSILASKLGAEHVYSTDGDSGVVQYLQENIQLNDAGALVTGFQKWWGEESPFDENLVGLDWILAADVVRTSYHLHDLAHHSQTYDPSIVPLLITELEQLHAKNPEAKMIVAATMRNFDTFECFNKGLDEAGFKTKQYTWTVEEGSLFYYQSSTPIKLVFITK